MSISIYTKENCDFFIFIFLTNMYQYIHTSNLGQKLEDQARVNLVHQEAWTGETW